MTEQTSDFALTGVVTFTGLEIAKKIPLSRDVIRRCIVELCEMEWLEDVSRIEVHGNKASRTNAGALSRLYAITPSHPTSLEEEGLRLLVPLQAYCRTYFNRNELLYGYGTALSYHELSDIILKEDVYAWHLDRSVRPPNMPAHLPFQRSTRKPPEKFKTEGLVFHVSRRHPDAVDAEQKKHVPVGGLLVPMTGVERTLLDCWMRPDLAGGMDRVISAWKHHVSGYTLASFAKELAEILRKQPDDRPEMRQALFRWMKEHVDSELGPESLYWSGLV